MGLVVKTILLLFSFHFGYSSVVDSRRNCTFVQGLHANLIRFITNEGFHRDLKESVEVTVTNSPIPIQLFTTGDCVFALLTKFLNEIYIDPYEIARHPRLSKTMRVLNKWTDLENPSWLASSNSTAFIHLRSILTGNLISTEEVKIPIHFRYQRPLSHTRLKNRYFGSRDEAGSGIMHPGAYVQVNVPLPRLLLRCSNWDDTTVEADCGQNIVNTICSKGSDSICPWISIPFKSNTKGSSVFIPIGDLDSQLLVTTVTILVIFAGMLFLLRTLRRAKEEIDRVHEHVD